LQSTHGYGFNSTVLGRLMTRSSAFLEYIKLHQLSLAQDIDKMDMNDPLLANFEGQLIATTHILSVATDIMNASDERYE